MLRITVHDDPESLTFYLEGRLAGTYAIEMEECLRKTLAAHPNRAVRIDLTQVTSLDAAGRALLAASHTQGAKLIAAGCLMKAIVEEITGHTADGPHPAR